MNPLHPTGGEVNGYPRPPPQRPQQPPRPRYTVDEALQRTPLASINPFDPETLPIPQAVPSLLCPTMMSNHQRAAAKEHIRYLDRTLQQPSADKSSYETQQKLQDLHFLLTKHDFMQYQFQPLPIPPPHPSAPTQSTNANGAPPLQNPAPKLGAFAEQLLASGAFASSFRYPTPSSRKTSPARRQPSSASHRQTSTHLTPQQANQKAFTNNANAISPHVPITPARSPGVNSPASSAPMVMVPPPPTEEKSFRPHDRKADEELLRQMHESAMQKQRQSEEAKEIMRDLDVDQKARAQAATNALQQALAPVFDAEDHLEARSSSPGVRQYFKPAAEGDSYVLNDEILGSIDSVLAKAVGTKTTHDIPKDSLVRLQRLCAKVITSCSDLDASYPDNGTEDDMERWSMSLRTAAHAMSASRTMLRTMTAGRTDKELFSEETLSHLLSALNKIAESCVIPVVEGKSSSDFGQTIARVDLIKSSTKSIFQRAGRSLRLLGELLLSSELSEMATTSIETVCQRLIFAASPSSEKESILGSPKFETLRRNAMDCLARIFLRRPSSRQSILDEILSSLEKLPVARQSARNFKIIDGKPIQLVSALILQLIQTTATYIPPRQQRSKFAASKDESDDDASGDDDESFSEASPTKSKAKNGKTANGRQQSFATESSSDPLARISKPLWHSVQHNAAHVVQFLIARALKSSKTSDEPYRNLLDIFTEDFLSVLGHTDWPAAELILQYLLRHLVNIADNEKSSAPAKNMALELMGNMGSGIAELKHHLNTSANSLASTDELEAQALAAICRDHLESHSNEAESLALKGPYRMLTDFLGYRGNDDIQLQNARNYHLLQWSQRLLVRSQSPMTPMTDEKDPFVRERPPEDLSVWLATTIQEPERAATYNFQQVSTGVARGSYLLLVAQLTFCKAIVRISNILLRSLSSVHATCRSRGLKSVIQVLEKDPSMLDSNTSFVRYIVQAASDQSTMVRDAALQLIGRCIELRPHVELDFLDIMLSLTYDQTVGIRKRAIRQLKDSYLRNKDDATRIKIASSFLKRMDDEEDSVTDLARQTLEEMWISRYPAVTANNIPLDVQQDLNRHATQLVSIAEQSENVLQAFEPFFRALLSPKHKNAANNTGVCKAIAAAAFDNFIENDQQRSTDARANILALLSVLIRAQPDLLPLDQLKMLETYTTTLKTGADLRLYKPVAQIYQAAMPAFTVTDRDFIQSLQMGMISSLGKILHYDLMDEVTSCIWATQKALQSKHRLFATLQSMLRTLLASRDTDPKRALRVIRIVGYIGKAWDLNDFLPKFKEQFTWFKGNHVSELIVQVLLPSTGASYPPEVRQLSLEGICVTCNSWPDNYIRKDVLKTLEAALRSGDEKLQREVVNGLRGFFKIGETNAKPASEPEEDDKKGEPSDTLGASMISSDSDKASTMLAQHFFEDLQRIALKYTNELGLAATATICSTNRQGLIHPQQCVSVLVALGTSPNPAIAKEAYDEHLNLNSKHESILEREYINAVYKAFLYQRGTIKDSLGVILEPTLTPKLGLFFEVLKSSNIATRKKLLPNLCKRLNVNIAKLESTETLELSALFAKFVCQNMGLVSYGRVDEVMLICATLENIFSTTGNALSQRLEPMLSQESSTVSNSEEYGQLTLCAMQLTTIWRTRCHLRQVTTNMTSTTGKQDKRVTKDTSKAPVKSTNTPKHDDAFIKATEVVGALANEESMRQQCRVFLDLLTVDHEAKVVNSSDELENGREGTPTGDGSSVGTPSATPSGSLAGLSKKRRRSESVSAAGTPSGRKRGRPKLEKRRSSAKKAALDEDGWD